MAANRMSEDKYAGADVESQESSEPNMKAIVRPSLPVSTSEWVRGDPGPFGLLCFGMTTTMLMFITTGWSEKVFLPTVVGYALAFGGGGQFVAGILEIIKGNTFGGTVFASYGCFWVGWGLLEAAMIENKALNGAVGSAAIQLAVTGKTLWCGLWALLTFLFFIISCRKNGAVMTVLSSLTLCFMLLAGGVHSERCERAAGYVGAFCAASAIYTAFATMVKQELGYVLPGMSPVHFL